MKPHNSLQHIVNIYLVFVVIVVVVELCMTALPVSWTSASPQVVAPGGVGGALSKQHPVTSSLQDSALPQETEGPGVAGPYF